MNELQNELYNLTRIRKTNKYKNSPRMIKTNTNLVYNNMEYSFYKKMLQ